MWCKYCNKSLSNQFSYNRHIKSDNHIHNIQNTYHALSDVISGLSKNAGHKDIANLIWEFTYIKAQNPETGILYKVLDHLESGNKWKAYDIIRSRKMLPLCYTLVDLDFDNYKHREIIFTQYHVHHKHCVFIAGDYYLELDILDSDYVWTKLANIKDAVTKYYKFKPDRINDMINILY